MGEQYVVKSVLSGDTLTLLVPNKLPPIEKVVTLSGVDVPKVARAKGQRDDPWGWEARELIRKASIGKTVRYVHEFSNDKLQREFGSITTPEGVNLAVLLLSEGLADVRKRQNEPVAALAALEAAQQTGAANRKGKHSGDAADSHVRNVQWDITNPNHLANELANKTEKVIVEQVLNGGLIRVLLPDRWLSLAISLTGIRCPVIRGTGDKPEPFALEARFTTERAILHREITLLFEGLDQRGTTFLGSIINGDQCFQQVLLQRGLAEIADWSLGKTKFAPALRAAQQQAKTQRVNKWKDYVAQAVPDRAGAFRAHVVQVNSGDTITVVRADNKATIRVQLSSTRATKPIDERDANPGAQTKDRKLTYSNYAWEAREYLRHLLVGKEVIVEPDYTRRLEGAAEERLCATVRLGAQNVAAALIAEGLAKTVYSPEEHNRSQFFAELKAAEQEGAKKKLAESTTVVVTELNRPEPKKAKQFLSFLQRGGTPQNPPRLAAIVEAVLSPSRFRVYIPRQQIVVTLALTGINTPSLARQLPNGTTTETDPFAQEAFDFARDSLSHRDVEVEIENVDPHGTFLGSLHHAGENVATQLLQQGLAKQFAVERTKYHIEYKAAENDAVHAKKGIWSSPESQPKARISKRKLRLQRLYGDITPVESREWQPYQVTEVTDSITLWGQPMTEAVHAQLRNIEQLLARLALDASQQAPTALIKGGDTVVAKFTADNALYRAVVRRTGADFTVQYLDYGNTETLPRERVWKVPAVDQSVKTTPPLAVPLGLAFLAQPTADEELATEAIQVARGYLQDGPLLARTEYVDAQKKAFVTLRQQQTDSVGTAQTELVKLGFGRIDKRFKPGGKYAGVAQYAADVTELIDLEDKAKRERVNIWQYGDIESGED
eukprot:TRINITY_DN54304_c0_g1_i1.p1 TRINITY_DN54304_c0_g1~~TRINITY_DN54304_c0_g1_i1.p1  ORF type:complete len:893 (-),score=182.83 TRINITY_DN54304_c0_g1_i1:55-2733(-)